MEKIEAEHGVLDYHQAGISLGKRLNTADLDNAVVVGIARAGVLVAAALAESLTLPMEIITYRFLKDPARASRSIGCVTEHEMVLQDCPFDLPQDYIYHEIVQARNTIAGEQRSYYENEVPASLRYRTVIIVSDVLLHDDAMEACIKEVRRQTPLKIIVAVPFAEAEAARAVQSHCDEVIFLSRKQKIRSSSDCYAGDGEVGQGVVREILRGARLQREKVPS